jgi:hypothetical protein
MEISSEQLGHKVAGWISVTCGLIKVWVRTCPQEER